MSQTVEENIAEHEFTLSQTAQLQRWLPWIRLYRAFRMAIDYRRIVIAMVAVTLWSAGIRLLNPVIDESRAFRNRNHNPWVGPVTSPLTGHVSEIDRRWPWENTLHPAVLIPHPAAFSTPTDTFSSQFRLNEDIFLHSPHFSIGGKNPFVFDQRSLSPAPEKLGGLVVPSSSNLLWMMARPVYWVHQQFLEAAKPLVFPSSHLNWIVAWGNTLWILLISGLFGGAICRMAASDFTGNGEISVKQGLSFSLRHLISCLGAPLIPLVGIVACWVPNLLAGLITRIPGVGETLVGFVWIFPMIASMIMALIVAGIAVSWSLMIAGVTTEASDAFDGLSRAFSYVFNQLWYVAFLLILTVAMGTISLWMVTLVLRLGYELLLSSILSGSGPNVFQSDLGQSSLGANAILSWNGILPMFQTAYLFSYYWTAATVIYILLRQRDDGTPLTELGGLPRLPSREGIPVVGMPAATNRELQISAESQVENTRE